MDLFNMPTQASQEKFLAKVAQHRQDTLKAEREHEDRVRVYRIKEDLAGELDEALKQTAAENRTALVVSSLE